MGNTIQSMFWKEKLETQTPNSMSKIPSHKCCTRILKNEYNFEDSPEFHKPLSLKQREQLKKYLIRGTFDKFYDNHKSWSENH